jgi:hypothetical protein
MLLSRNILSVEATLCAGKILFAAAAAVAAVVVGVKCQGCLLCCPSEKYMHASPRLVAGFRSVLDRQQWNKN